MKAYPVRHTHNDRDTEDKVIFCLEGTSARALHHPFGVVSTDAVIEVTLDEAKALVEDLQWALKACSHEPLSEEEAAVLRAELEEKMPAAHVNVDDRRGYAWWYDYYGVMYRDTNAEDEFVHQYLVDVIAAKVGHRVVITKYGSAGNGHDSCAYERE